MGKALQQGFKEMVAIFLSKDLDFLSKLLVISVAASIVYLIVYLVLPMSGRRTFEKFDLNEAMGGVISVTGAGSILTLIFLGVSIMTKR